MKRINFTFLFLLFAVFSTTAFASDPDTLMLQKQCFYRAKQELIGMLDGRQPLSYERAIFIIENAYANEEMDFDLYRKAIDRQVKDVQSIITLNKGLLDRKIDSSILHSAKSTPEKSARASKNLVANWAIYSAMRDTVVPVWIYDSWYPAKNVPYTYSYSDPLGTRNWENTQVAHLLYTHQGNCFALASLYKILADRLHTDAVLCTAPGHIYIVHKDEEGREFNVELSNGYFPGSGTMGTLTYTTNEAIENDIALRQLDVKQSVALCLSYLAKGYQYKFGIASDSFMLHCAEAALRYDPKSLNAMLLKAEILEHDLLETRLPVARLRADSSFREYEQLIGRLYTLGYREMPLDMKNKLIKGWTKDTTMKLAYANYNPPAKNQAGMENTRYASLSWGFFEEEIPEKPVEQYGSTLFDTKKGKITGFAQQQLLYNDYNFDPVAFAWNVDPLAYQFPHESPYSFAGGNPIYYVDQDGRKKTTYLVIITEQATTKITVVKKGEFRSSNNDNGGAQYTKYHDIIETTTLDYRKGVPMDKRVVTKTELGDERTLPSVVAEKTGVSSLDVSLPQVMVFGNSFDYDDWLKNPRANLSKKVYQFDMKEMGELFDLIMAGRSIEEPSFNPGRGEAFEKFGDRIQDIINEKVMDKINEEKKQKKEGSGFCRDCGNYFQNGKPDDVVTPKNPGDTINRDQHQ